MITMGTTRQFFTTPDRNNVRVFICISFFLDFINFFTELEYALRSFVEFLNFQSMITVDVHPFSSILTISSAESDKNNRQSESPVKNFNKRYTPIVDCLLFCNGKFPNQFKRKNSCCSK